MASDEKLSTAVKLWTTQRDFKRFSLIAYEKLLDKECAHSFNASIPNPGPDGPSINFWNSSVDIPSFTSKIQ